MVVVVAAAITRVVVLGRAFLGSLCGGSDGDRLYINAIYVVTLSGDASLPDLHLV